MKKLLYTLFFITLFCSCESLDETNPTISEDVSKSTLQENTAPSLPTSKNGILLFKDWDSAEFWINETKDLDENSRRMWEKKFNDFNSLDALFEYLVEVENLASDSLLMVFESTHIMPERVNLEYPIHSKKVEDYLDLLYFYPGGGFIPFASKVKPGIERILNAASEVYIGSNLYKYSNGKETVNGNVIKTPNLENFYYNETEYNERHQNTIGNYRTITDILYKVETRPYFNTSWTESTVNGNIVLRNFRKGLFGWNTRKTTSLKIEGSLDYYFQVCGFSFLQHDYPSISITSNGQNTTSLEFYFTLPTQGNWMNEPYCSNSWLYSINHDLTITGENNNVSNFANQVSSWTN